LTPNCQTKVSSDWFYGEICSTELKVSPFLVGMCM
jgi:hypothetical protein